MMTDRVFKNGMCLHFEDRVQRSASLRYQQSAVWVEMDCRGPTGKPYVYQSLGVVNVQGSVLAVARVNRGGAVYWREQIGGEGWRLADEPSPSRREPHNTSGDE
jgi:hypothetical protein